MKHRIYALLNKNGVPVYVGRTKSKDLHRRLNNHFREGGNLDKLHWMLENRDHIEILEIDSADTLKDANQLEQYWISRIKTVYDLPFNNSIGGYGNTRFQISVEQEQLLGHISDRKLAEILGCSCYTIARLRRKRNISRWPTLIKTQELCDRVKSALQLDWGQRLTKLKIISKESGLSTNALRQLVTVGAK